MTGVDDGASRRAQELRAAICEAAGPARRYVLGLCGSWELAADVVQEAMLKAWAKQDSFDGRANARTWLFAIVRNQYLDALRRKQARKDTQPMIDASDIPDSRTPSPLRAAAGAELASAVELAMGNLPPEQREALALRESQGLSFAQIAQMLGLPLPTVKSRVRYALLKLAAELHGYRGDI